MSRLRLAARWGGAALVAILAAGIIAPYLQADRFGKRIQSALEGALGRRVDIGKVRFDLFRGPGFQIENVVIHEDPSIGLEPLARVTTMEVSPSLWWLLRGQIVVSSIRLEDARINLTKTGAASEPGRWNFERLLNPAHLRAFPAVSVRAGRINFKFGDSKSVFYLTETDLDVSPSGREWRIRCEAQPARTDRPARGLGSFSAKGAWRASEAGGLLDLDVHLERSGLGEITALLRGSDSGVHGTVSARVRLTGPLRGIRIAGRMNIEDVHRWDLLPPKGEGWPLDVRGRLDLVSQQLELESNSAGNVELPLYVRFRVTDYLSQPHWGVSVNWNRFPAEPLLELARHMGVQLTPKLKLAGAIEGALGYSGQGSFQGQLSFQNPVLTAPDSAPLRAESATVVFGQGHVKLRPTLVRVRDDDQATIEADYSVDEETLELDIQSDAMNVASLRSQVALAAVPWLEQLQSGVWRGQLHYRRAGELVSGWSGKLMLENAVIPVPGLAAPVRFDSARVQIDRARVVLDRIEAKAGPITVTGEYRYEPQAARPHRVRLAAGAVDAAAIEALFAPTLRRGSSLLARAFGRSPLPDWMKTRNVEGTLQLGALLVGGTRLENFRAHLLWDVTQAELNGVQARVEKGALTGKLAVNLRGAAPAYRFTGRVKDLLWQGGKFDVEGSVAGAGGGLQLLAGMKSEGAFTAAGFDLGGLAVRSAAGTYALEWARTGPRLRFTDLEIESGEDTLTGRGETLEDGHLQFVLSNGARELRIGGPPAKLKMEEPPPTHPAP
jgi:hypothetical protein